MVGPYRKLITAALLAGAVLAAQWLLANLLAFVPMGTRAMGTGASVSTALFVLAGYLVGQIERKTSGTPDGVSRPVPFGLALMISAAIGAVGLLGWWGLGPHLLFPPDSIGEGGAGRAMLATDAVLFPAASLVSIGAGLGVNSRPGTTLFGLAGAGALVGLSLGLRELIRQLVVDPGLISALTTASVGVSALVVGFGLAWTRRRLAFVEMAIVALLCGYVLYLGVATGPAALVGSWSLPIEQILLALSIVPSIALMALLAVGGSLGFLLFGSGRLDVGFGFEAHVAKRYLQVNLRGLGRGGPPFVGVVTLISIVGVALGVMALVVVLSVMSGFENDLKSKILGAHAHVVIEKYGQDFLEHEAVERQARGAPGVLTAAAFVLGDAMMSTDVGLSGTLVKGVDPSSEDAIGELRQNLERGRVEYLSSPADIPGACGRALLPPPPKIPPASNGSTIAPPLALERVALAGSARCPGRVLPGVIIGKELSRTLRAYVGDVVKLVSPVSDEIGPLGPTPKLRRFRVAGIFYSGMYEYDAKLAYLSMNQAQRFFGMRGKASGVELKIADIDASSLVVGEIERRLGGEPYRVKDWREMNKELFSALLLEKIAMFVALTMIIMVASFLIVATLVMIVLQRGREIALLKSVGASSASIMKIFVIQGVIVGVGGALLGVFSGVSICLLLETVGLRLDERIFYIEQLPVVLDWTEVGIIAVSAMIITYLATIYPAMTAAVLQPVDGLREE